MLDPQPKFQARVRLVGALAPLTSPHRRISSFEFRTAVPNPLIDNHRNHERPQQDRGHEPLAPEPLRAGDQHRDCSLRP